MYVLEMWCSMKITEVVVRVMEVVWVTEEVVWVVAVTTVLKHGSRRSFEEICFVPVESDSCIY